MVHRSLRAVRACLTVASIAAPITATAEQQVGTAQQQRQHCTTIRYRRRTTTDYSHGATVDLSSRAAVTDCRAATVRGTGSSGDPDQAAGLQSRQ